MTQTCARLNNIEALARANENPPATDILWMVEQMRGWQKFAERVVDFGDHIGQLRTVSVSNPRVADDILTGYEGLFKR